MHLRACTCLHACVCMLARVCVCVNDCMRVRMYVQERVCGCQQTRVRAGACVCEWNARLKPCCIPCACEESHAPLGRPQTWAGWAAAGPCPPHHAGPCEDCQSRLHGTARATHSQRHETNPGEKWCSDLGVSVPVPVERDGTAARGEAGWKNRVGVCVSLSPTTTLHPPSSSRCPAGPAPSGFGRIRRPGTNSPDPPLLLCSGPTAHFTTRLHLYLPVFDLGLIQLVSTHFLGCSLLCLCEFACVLP